MNDYHRDKHDILLLNLLSSMDQKDMNKLTSELDKVEPGYIRLDLDNILNTFEGDYDMLVESIREQIYYRAAVDSSRSSLAGYWYVYRLINELNLPDNMSYRRGLINSMKFMLDSLAYQGLSVTLSEWLIFAAMWDQPPYNYVKFIMDIWSDKGLRERMYKHNFHDDIIIAPETLLQYNIFDYHCMMFKCTRTRYDYEDEIVELLEWVKNNMGYYEHWGDEDESVYIHAKEDDLNYIRTVYSEIRDHTTPQLALSILDALNNKRSIDLFKLVYEYFENI